MDFIDQDIIDSDADDLEEDIIKQFGKFNVNIGIKRHRIVKKRIIFSIKTKGNTREAHIRANAPEVQRKLKLPIFHVVKHNFNLFLIVSREKLIYDGLCVVLSTQGRQEVLKHMRLPYIIGHDVLGNVVIVDMVQFPHLLLGGSTSSGKSVGLKALITSIAYCKPPSRVNFVLIDVGATDLMCFEGLPHLSCPIVRDRTTAVHALTALTKEMERRIALEYSDPTEFKRLPRLVIAIDEFPALFMIDKAMSKTLIKDVSSLLQRGRHARIHLVLAAQNPTCQNMKIDLGNITARMAFKCAKRNFSETILGESGAEKLMGQGDLLLRSPRYDTLQRIQGIFITPQEIQNIVQNLKNRYREKDVSKYNLVLANNGFAETTVASADRLSCSVIRKWPSDADVRLAEVIMWALEHDSISINLLMKEKRLGWNTASKLVARLEELGLVDKPESKLPREVIPQFPEEIPEELMKFLENVGYDQYRVYSAIYRR